MDDLKQLLLGTLLWSPITFMQVGPALCWPVLAWPVCYSTAMRPEVPEHLVPRAAHIKAVK
jgi:hypothetical protein